MNGPGMIADGERIKIQFKPMSGERLADLMAGFYSASPELLKKVYAATYTR